MQTLTRREFGNRTLIALVLPKLFNIGPTTTGDFENEILEAEQALASASLDGKWEVADRILAADYVQVEPDGSVYRKDKVISSIKEWAKFPVAIRPSPEVTQSDLITRIVGETAIVVGKVISKIGYASYEDYVKNEFPKLSVHESRFTQVWIRSENRWQLFSSHRTNIVKTVDR